MAKKQKKQARTQQWVAEKVARANLAKQIEVLIEAVCKSKRIGRFSDDLLVQYESDIDCRSIQKTKQRFSIYNLDPLIQDRWIDPRNGNMYVWIVVPDEP
ncbi:MAG: hypothetical protein ACQERN_04865 [Thermodesulfobacteriota bacterium]